MANKDTEITIYNGKHKVAFHNDSHRYYVDGKQKQGVTTIMSQVLAKPGLMLWPMNMALKHLQSKLPTITLADFDDARQAHVKRRDHGADTGTIVHEIVEKILLDPSKPAYKYMLEMGVDSDDALIALHGFELWYDRIKPKTIAVEQVVYSAFLDFAGTFDSILEIDGKTYLCDLKTTNASLEAPKGVYADYFVQLGAYLYAYNEQREYELHNGGSTDLVAIDDVMILSCKKDRSVHTVTGSEVGLTTEDCMQLWTSTLFIHRNLSRTRKKLAPRKETR